MTGMCPRDDKRSYVHERAALDSLESLKAKLGMEGVVPYQCVCGMWHLGHPVEGIDYKTKSDQ